MSRSDPIDVDHVTKRYGDFLAVDAISFSVREGMIFGLLGPNGAGKTTTIRMIMNIIAPDSGEVRIFGEPSTAGSSRRIGYLPEERGLYRKMRVLDHLAFLGEIRGLDAKTSKRGSSARWMNSAIEATPGGGNRRCPLFFPRALPGLPFSLNSQGNLFAGRIQNKDLASFDRKPDNPVGD